MNFRITAATTYGDMHSAPSPSAVRSSLPEGDTASRCSFRHPTCPAANLRCSDAALQPAQTRRPSCTPWSRPWCSGPERGVTAYGRSELCQASSFPFSACGLPTTDVSHAELTKSARRQLGMPGRLRGKPGAPSPRARRPSEAAPLRPRPHAATAASPTLANPTSCKNSRTTT
jgi:hypothetical protein